MSAFLYKKAAELSELAKTNPGAVLTYEADREAHEKVQNAIAHAKQREADTPPTSMHQRGVSALGTPTGKGPWILVRQPSNIVEQAELAASQNQESQERAAWQAQVDAARGTMQITEETLHLADKLTPFDFTAGGMVLGMRAAGGDAMARIELSERARAQRGVLAKDTDGMFGRDNGELRGALPTKDTQSADVKAPLGEQAKQA